MALHANRNRNRDSARRSAQSVVDREEHALAFFREGGPTSLDLYLLDLNDARGRASRDTAPTDKFGRPREDDDTSGALTETTGHWRRPRHWSLPGTRSRLGRVAFIAFLAAKLGIGLHLLMPSATDQLARKVIAGVSSKSIAASVDRSWRCSKVIPVFVEDGRLADLIADNRRCDLRDQRLRFAPMTAAGAAALRPYLEAVEGDYQVSPETLAGLNIKGWLLAPYRGFAAGGSNAIETAVKNALGVPGRSRLLGKLRNGFVTTVFTAHFLGTPESRDRFAQEMTPCARGAEGSRFGAPVAGNLCSHVLFGKRGVLDTTPAERCYWVSALRDLVRIVGPQSPEKAVRQAIEVDTVIRARAARCLDKVAGVQGWSAAELADEKASLRAIAVAAPANTDLPANPASRAAISIPGSRPVLEDAARLSAANASALTITLDARAQVATDRFIQEWATRVGPRLNPHLCVPGACRDGQSPADVMVVLAETTTAVPQIKVAWSNRQELFFGPIQLEAGKWLRGRPHRPIGSLGKMLLSLPAAKTGVTGSCNKSFAGVQNPGTNGDKGVSDCGNGAGLVSIASMYERSLNLPAADLAFRVGPGKLRELASDLGFSISPGNDDAFVRGLVLGYGTVATPETMLRMVAAFQSASVRGKALAYRPTLFTQTEGGGKIDLALLGYSPEVTASAARLLASPVGGSRGTLRSLSPVLRQRNCDVEAFGKTGTSDSPVPFQVRDKLAIAAFSCGEHHYAAVVLVGSPDPEIPLGDVTASDLAQLIGAALKGAEAR